MVVLGATWGKSAAAVGVAVIAAGGALLLSGAFGSARGIVKGTDLVNPQSDIVATQRFHRGTDVFASTPFLVSKHGVELTVRRVTAVDTGCSMSVLRVGMVYSGTSDDQPWVPAADEPLADFDLKIDYDLASPTITSSVVNAWYALIQFQIPNGCETHIRGFDIDYTAKDSRTLLEQFLPWNLSFIPTTGRL